MILVVDDPEHVSAFIRFVKGEIAHAINIQLGRRKKTIWAEGYDSPIILTAIDVERYIHYIYLNPSKADLVETIDSYPGVSSWEMFLSGNCKSTHQKQPRPSILPLPQAAISINEQRRLVDIYENQNHPKFEFELEPFAWITCFSEFEGVDLEEIKSRIISEIQEAEEELSLKRKAKKKRVIGATKLRRQSMLIEYQPEKYSKRMICLCFDKELRKAFISHFRELCFQARQAYQSWKRGDLAPKIPPGLFAPALPGLVSEISVPL